MLSFLALLLTLAINLAVSALASLPVPVTGHQASQALATHLQNQQSNHTVHILSHGWHTGVAVPAADLFVLLPPLERRFPNHQWLEIGWGDSGFYQTENVGIGITLQAMFVPTTSVVHVVGFNMEPGQYFSESAIHSLSLSQPDYINLLAYLAQSFHLSGDAQLEFQNPGIYGDSQFFTGVGSYTIMNTCNKWTAKALRSAGLPIATTFALTSSSIMNFLARHEGGVAATGTQRHPAGNQLR